MTEVETTRKREKSAFTNAMQPLMDNGCVTRVGTHSGGQCVAPPHFATVPRDLGTRQTRHGFNHLQCSTRVQTLRDDRSPHISITRVGPVRRPGPTATRGRHMCVLSASPRMEDGWVFGSRVPPHAHQQTITRKLTTCPRPGRIGEFRERKHLLT